MSDYPPLTIYNEQDEPIGEASLAEIHQKGHMYRSVMVAVHDPEGRLLLQKRTDKVLANKNRWDISAAGHVDVGEDYLTAAKREMFEEIGVSTDSLKEKAYYRSNEVLDGRKLNRFVTIYETTVPADTHFTIDTEEVSEVRWFTIEELKQLLATKPEELNHDFAIVLNKITK